MSRGQHNNMSRCSSWRLFHPLGRSLITSGSMGSFDYGVISPLAALRERRPSDEFPFTSSIDDTSSFVHQQPRKKRVDGDASSFYFRASGHSKMHPYARAASHRRYVDSLGPPISMYNRSHIITETHHGQRRAGSYGQGRCACGLGTGLRFPYIVYMGCQGSGQCPLACQSTRADA